MREDDLEQFAIGDGLLARMAADPGYMSERERDYLLIEGARVLARAADLSGEEAYRLIHPFTRENQTTLQACSTFAAAFALGGCSTPSAVTTCAGGAIPNGTRMVGNAPGSC